jgi:hypothetical protein
MKAAQVHQSHPWLRVGVAAFSSRQQYERVRRIRFLRVGRPCLRAGPYGHF